MSSTRADIVLSTKLKQCMSSATMARDNTLVSY